MPAHVAGTFEALAQGERHPASAEAARALRAVPVDRAAAALDRGSAAAGGLAPVRGVHAADRREPARRQRDRHRRRGDARRLGRRAAGTDRSAAGARLLARAPRPASAPSGSTPRLLIHTGGRPAWPARRAATREDPGHRGDRISGHPPGAGAAVRRGAPDQIRVLVQSRSAALRRPRGRDRHRVGHRRRRRSRGPWTA